MSLLTIKKIIHYPSLKTILMVEKVLASTQETIDREEIKRRLPVKIMHQTLNVILEYLEQKGIIIDSHKGILWIYNPSKKLEEPITLERKITKLEKQEDIRKKMISLIVSVLSKYPVSKASLFGSYARGEQREDSDVDILIEINDKNYSLLNLAEIENELSNKINKKVDLLTYNSINPLIKQQIEKEQIRII